MELHEAITTIRALADGLNPVTRQALDPGDACRQPQAVKALNRSLSALVAQQEREKRAPGNAYKAWSRTEDAQVCEELRQGKDFAQIAKAHNRTVPAIVARLVKMGKITPAKSDSIPERIA